MSVSNGGDVPSTPSVPHAPEDCELHARFVEACLEIAARSRDPWAEIKDRLLDFGGLDGAEHTDSGENQPPLREDPSIRYATIVADPPWDVKRPTGWSSTSNHQGQPYATLTLSEIANLNVAPLVADVSWLFLWTVNAYVEESYFVARAWGFRPVTLLTWCKEPRGIGPGGMFATTSEFILYARKGSTPDGRRKAVNSSWFTWPRRGQSEKPEAFFDLVETHFPGPYLELFARRQRLGWDTWGNEALEHVKVVT